MSQPAPTVTTQIETPTGRADRHPLVNEYDDEYFCSPFAGIGLFLTGRVDTDAVRAAFSWPTIGGRDHGRSRPPFPGPLTGLGRVA